ncbi:MAG: hypothetical protein MUO77_08300 [Anaerolineales bacterium]|nr:hypothetical protein [Anaerolineales bacterium]
MTNPSTKQEIDNSPYDAAMNTYIAVGINVQHGSTNAPSDRDAGNGPAQVSQNQLDAPYGEPYDDEEGKMRGYGLGLPGKSPFDDDVAVQAMNNRIQQVMDETDRLGEKNNITIDNNDRFTVAALSQNGAGFDLDDISQVMNNYTEDGKIDWDGYFKFRQDGWDEKINEATWLNPADWGLLRNNIRTGGDSYDTKFILRKFTEEIETLEEEGYYLPADVDMQKIKDLSEGVSTPGEDTK